MKYAVLVALTVAVAGILMTGRVARLVRRNHKAIRITLAEEYDRSSRPAAERKKEVFLPAEASCGRSQGVKNSNPTDVAYLDSVLRFVGEVPVLSGAVNPKSRLSTGVYGRQQLVNSSAVYK